ncbi:hypothetical protein BWQ96_10874 [Gracilariopsis chorda]|uniref:Uncharacterized protein n=1 Tax=Gracilariopsis chorda TaxID=448386 RepID=A0A2V3IBF2_9FLOR|nr:hypothetical protein BWQ96_10874 [Gracilariopsis chorda]|eukprot:PXF39439.1 hypothetical protein BWQ96_10874 [Gracilariopsis chorda]
MTLRLDLYSGFAGWRTRLRETRETDGKTPEEKRDRRRRHKLAPIATGPHEVVEFDQDTVVIRRGKEVERISRDRVVSAPSAEADAQQAVASRADSQTLTPSSHSQGRKPTDVPPQGKIISKEVPPGDAGQNYRFTERNGALPPYSASVDDIIDLGSPVRQ